MKKPAVILAGIALYASLAASAHAQSVNINFDNSHGGGGLQGSTLAPTDIAGVVPSGNYNNLPAGANTGTLLNINGGATTVTESNNAVNTFENFGNGQQTDPNYTLTNGSLDSGISTAPGYQTNTVTIAGLASGSPYDVYVYFANDQGPNGATRNATYTLTYV